MRKSTRPCLRIITCAGGDSTDGEDLNPSVIKASPDNSRWSFWKKSSGNRVLNNNLISEPASVGNIKENTEATTNDFHLLKKTQVQEQSSIVGDALSSVVVKSIADLTAYNGDTLSPVVVNSIADQTAGNGNNTTDHHLQDSVAVVIQAAIRRYLAQRDLQKLKNIVKLQASVRGRLVRRQAIGTLRCIHALVKMQTLVRARSAQLAVKEDEKSDIDRPMLVTRIRTFSTEQNRTYFSTEKLLSNRFACQLLESTPKTKHMHVKCDALQSDSTWKWLERWMTVTSPDRKEELEQDPLEGVHGQVENDEQAADSISSDFKADSSESAVTNEGEGSSIYRNSTVAEFQSPTSVPNDDCFSSQSNIDKDQSQLENSEALNMELGNINATNGEGKTSVSFSGQMQLLSDATSHSILSSISDIPESDGHKPKPTAKRPSSSEPLEDKGKKFTLGSRKPCNPAFAAAQSKFEELSSTITPSRCITPAYQDASSESKFESPTYQVASSTKNTNISSVENALPHDPRVQVAASECGTEISISSTLDSPERSEAEDGEIVLEIGAFKKGNNANFVDAYDISNQASGDDKTKLYSLDTEVPHLQREEKGNGDLVNSAAVADAQLMEQHLEEPSTSDTKNHSESLIEPHVYKSTPEGTPRRHINAHESRGTPPSQATVNTKKGKKDNNMEAQNQIDQLVGKKSPSNSKVSRRRKSLETDKPDRVDHEPRISSSGSLPSYMQATKSARAKAHASTSPKSSPDVHRKDDHTKKRHSLPIGDEKQGSSPHTQRASQAQQNLMGNGTHSPHNSAERRWQR